MAKKIFMISPFEVLTGNLSGSQDLTYGQENTAAYEAANGKQGAHDYRARFIGARRADGRAYFSIKTKSTTVLNNKTRTEMALTGSIAAIRSAVMALPAASSGRKPWDTIKAAYDKYKAENQGEKDARSLQAYFDARVRDMLRYKRASVTFTAAVGGWVLRNPYSLSDVDAVVISQRIWNKFCLLLAFGYDGMAQFTIDKFAFITPLPSMTWGAIKPMLDSCCPNFKASWHEITIDNADNVLFREQKVYSSAGVAQESSSACAVDAYTTIEPEA